MSETGDIISRIYGGFRGVDFRGEEIPLTRSPDSLNVWKDYKETDSIRTRPEMALLVGFDETIYGIYFYGGYMIVHSGNTLYKMLGVNKTEFYKGVKAAHSNAFVYENIWYFMDGERYLQYDGKNFKDVEGYVPTTSIGRKPSGGGTVYEDVNMLQSRRINTFLADGKSFDYYLDVTNIDKDFTPIVKVNDKVVTDVEINYDKSLIKFKSMPVAPLTDGQDNVSVEFKKTVERYRRTILNCTMLQVFDNRVFVSGNDEFPNTVWHCSLNDPTYFSDLDYYREGVDSAKIKGIVAGNNALWVFREPSESNTTVFYHTPTIDAEYGKIYPSQHSSITTGCIGKAINFNDDIVFFSERGMEGISGDVTTEQAIAHRSSLVDRKLLSLPDYKDMILEEWEGYLFAFVGDKAFLADSRTAFQYENHMEYDWFYWDLGKTVTYAKVKDGVFYLGTEDGIYTLTDTKSAVESYWVTPKDKFNSPNKVKTTNKRGCVVEATGDISVYAKTDKTEFEFIGKYENITDSFTSRIKRKKFKDIQLKFHSDTRFSLETATLECFIGGYIKR
jgi:hypothetical protein